MVARILVPLDGSALGERALPYATAVARAAHARLILMHARPPDELRPGLAFDVGAVAARVADGTIDIETRMVDVHDDAVGEAVGRAICEVGREQHVDLIAMSTHGRGGLERWVYGSSADKVFRKASAPVLLITAGCEHHLSQDRRVRMLVPLDGSAHSEVVLGPVTALADVLKADLLLTRIVEADLGSQVEKEQALAREYLTAIQGRLHAAGQTADTFTETGHPASAIVDIARRHEVDLIAMSTHGHGSLARLAFGSTATRILPQARVPLLLAYRSCEAVRMPRSGGHAFSLRRAARTE